jgi:hypothetical protein
MGAGGTRRLNRHELIILLIIVLQKEKRCEDNNKYKYTDKL